jgi:uncharacterized protein YndB with AHSA1/START domain
MAAITTDIDVARPPGEVFSYVTDPSRFAEWQAGVVSGHTVGDGAQAPGTRSVVTRHIGGSDRAFTSEITEIDPPRSWAIRGIDGPVRAVVKITVESRQDGRASHVAISVDFSGHGLGKVLLPGVARQARKDAPQNWQKLKERLEQAG